MPSSTITTDIILFDLDGTLVESTASVEKTWEDYHEKYGIDLTDLYQKSHGARTIDTFTKYFPQLAIDGDMTAAAKLFDMSIVNDNGHLSKPIDGAVELMKSLNNSADGLQKWAICTSGTPALAHGWFTKVLPVEEPKIFVTAVDVTQGKPHPEPYLKGAALLSAEHGLTKEYERKIVFEDAPAGIKAGKAAGAIVVGILSSFDKPVLDEAGADYVVKDLTHVKVVKNDKDGIVLEVDHE
ncbi:2-deoxyglucose-6-phosphatase [Saccharomycopsis crataegensis]|uniref:2-deoxyglucose-6-phosphatase n=1 Tax=Saccharomycopsis crataegensis TaxID=43959 RepID=A0AAV5QPK9_9ASCO|nr:2-deoxyglucose-6-phosphatase [Saccharomycopsis crataegensis]